MAPLTVLFPIASDKDRIEDRLAKVIHRAYDSPERNNAVLQWFAQHPLHWHASLAEKFLKNGQALNLDHLLELGFVQSMPADYVWWALVMRHPECARVMLQKEKEGRLQLTCAMSKWSFIYAAAGGHVDLLLLLNARRLETDEQPQLPHLSIDDWLACYTAAAEAGQLQAMILLQEPVFQTIPHWRNVPLTIVQKGNSCRICSAASSCCSRHAF